MAPSGGTRTTERAPQPVRPADANECRHSFQNALLDGAPDPIVATDRDGRVRYANPACATLFAGACEEIIGHHVSQFLARHEPELEADARGSRRGHAEIRLAGGETRFVAYTASPLPASDGCGLVVYLRDETERRRDELRLARHNDELEQTIRALAHDLRSPLVSVLGFSRLLGEEYGPALGERGTHLLERITEAGRTMESLIRDLLEFARIGHEADRPALVDPRGVLVQLRAELKPRLEQQNVAIELPEQPPLVRCDRTRLYQLFSNLIGNALDHMGPCESPRIEVAVLERDDSYELIVCDNGRGIPPEQCERVFDMFHSVPHPGGRKGTGIGLAIVKKIAERNGGRVFVESATGHGAAFHVLLPRG